MDTKDLVERLTARIQQYLAGMQLETNKFEVKKVWYNLRVPQEKNEFLKDVSAITNSYGGEEGYIVFGIDEKTKNAESTTLSSCGYSDPVDLKNIINSNIEPPIGFDILQIEVDGRSLSVLRIYPSTEKPHFILEYVNSKNQRFLNEVFIRSGAGNVVAGKADIDRMFVERKNIVLARNLEVSINLIDLVPRTDSNDKFILFHPLTIENTGSRVAAISSIELELLFGEAGGNLRNITFFTTDYGFSHLVIPSGTIFNGQVRFKSFFDDQDYIRRVVPHYIAQNTRIKSCRIVLSNEEIVFPKLIVHTRMGEKPINFNLLL